MQTRPDAATLLDAVAMGLLMAMYRPVRIFFDPLIATLFPIPKVALMPLLLLAFGFGDASKIALVAFTCVFPFIVAAYAGATTVPTHQLWAARAMGTGNLGLLRRVILPASLPSLMSGVRVGVPYALVSTFSAEMIADSPLPEVRDVAPPVSTVPKTVAPKAKRAALN